MKPILIKNIDPEEWKEFKRVAKKHFTYVWQAVAVAFRNFIRKYK